MKAVLSFLLISLFCFIEFYNGTVYLTYMVNQSDIIRKYCVNKDKPQMRCEGMCHMKKMMINEEEDSQKQSSDLEIIPQILLFLEEFGMDLFVFNSRDLSFVPYRDDYRYRFSSELNVPPKG